jgi:hypothetical protein
MMKTKMLLSAALGALALGAVASATQAAPVGGLVAAVDREAASLGGVEQVTWGRWHRRHCYWHHGHRHCWWKHHHRRWW